MWGNGVVVCSCVSSFFMQVLSHKNYVHCIQMIVHVYTSGLYLSRGPERAFVPPKILFPPLKFTATNEMTSCEFELVDVCSTRK